MTVGRGRCGRVFVVGVEWIELKGLLQTGIVGDGGIGIEEVGIDAWKGGRFLLLIMMLMM